MSFRNARTRRVVSEQFAKIGLQIGGMYWTARLGGFAVATRVVAVGGRDVRYHTCVVRLLALTAAVRWPSRQMSGISAVMMILGCFSRQLRVFVSTLRTKYELLPISRLLCKVHWVSPSVNKNALRPGGTSTQ